MSPIAAMSREAMASATPLTEFSTGKKGILRRRFPRSASPFRLFLTKRSADDVAGLAIFHLLFDGTFWILSLRSKEDASDHVLLKPLFRLHALLHDLDAVAKRHAHCDHISVIGGNEVKHTAAIACGFTRGEHLRDESGILIFGIIRLLGFLRRPFVYLLVIVGEIFLEFGIDLVQLLPVVSRNLLLLKDAVILTNLLERRRRKAIDSRADAFTHIGRRKGEVIAGSAQRHAHEVALAHAFVCGRNFDSQKAVTVFDSDEFLWEVSRVLTLLELFPFDVMDGNVLHVRRVGDLSPLHRKAMPDEVQLRILIFQIKNHGLLLARIQQVHLRGPRLARLGLFSAVPDSDKPLCHAHTPFRA